MNLSKAINCVDNACSHLLYNPKPPILPDGHNYNERLNPYPGGSLVILPQGLLFAGGAVFGRILSLSDCLS